MELRWTILPLTGGMLGGGAVAAALWGLAGEAAAALAGVPSGVILTLALVQAVLVRPWTRGLERLAAQAGGARGGPAGAQPAEARASRGGLFGALCERMAGDMARFHRLAERLAEDGGRIAIAAAQASFAADKIRAKVHAEVEEANTIAGATTKISANVQRVARLSASAAAATGEARDFSRDGQLAVR